MNNPTRALRFAHLAATGALTAAATNIGIDWRLVVGVALWGLLTGTWAFSAGWDAALKPAKP